MTKAKSRRLTLRRHSVDFAGQALIGKHYVVGNFLVKGTVGDRQDEFLPPCNIPAVHMLPKATVESVLTLARGIYAGVLGTHHLRQVSEVAPSHSLGLGSL